ncbi:TonB-dependent receptor [Mucilaginibacter psychrotolerans]|uniref:TonB-dependent receptor n=2 Tax=Mucilaginibacter psychrotolerans TaxID=1524096 RepID=A0A4Y8SAU8_9SPHI|nr:TonB-dependent receptor [Mucilaginibacter psychrotolerans]
MAIACAGSIAMPSRAHAGINSVARQDVKITGVVTDEKGETLPGVTVSLKGTQAAAVTDVNGKFTLNIPDASGTLVFTYIGYIKQEIAINGQTTFNIKLEADSKSLNEVVVVGYGTQKKATLTGSISQVKGAELVKSPAPNLSNALAGRVAGVIVNNRSGEPGYDGSNITVRGLATTGSNNVLIVVDGVPGQIGGLERLDPNDIESMSVLKDASAAIYGNRAANGVILITTKRGKTGKPTINYSYNQGFSSPTRLPKMADAATYAQIMNEINYDSNPAGGLNQSYTAEQIQKFSDGSDPLNYPNTDWEKQTLKSYALQNQHSLSVAGGNDDVKYFVSLGTLYQDGLYKNGVTQYHQYNFRSNIDANVTKRLKVGLSISGRQEDRLFPQVGAGDVFRSVYRAKPIVAAFYPNGLPTTGIENNNPAVQVTDIAGTNRNPTQVFNGILKGSYALPGIEGLSLDGFFSVDKSNAFDKSFSKPYVLYSYGGGDVYNKVVVGGNNNAATLFESQNNQQLITSNIKLNFARKFGAHDINAFVGYEQSKSHLDYFDATRYNYLSSQLPELSQGGSAATDYLNSGYSSNYNRRSVISRLAYAYDEKYLFEGQLRADGSSIFPSGKQWGYFPSASVGWRVSKEEWFKNKVTFIDDLKLRASYGSLGNDNVNGFQYFDNYVLVSNGFVASVPGSGSNTIQPNVNLVKLANPNITWETARKLDIGLNATFLHNFTVEAIYFKQKRSSILATRNASLPGTSGIVNPYGSDPLVPSENIGKVNSEGVEGSLGYNSTTSSKFTWGISGNITYAKSNVVFIDEASGALDYQRQTGHPMNTYLLYNAIGIFRTQADLDAHPHVTGAKVGDLIYEDYNKDGKITADDQTRTKYGNIPQITYGIALNAAYKNFDISILFAGQAQVSQYVLPESGSIGNFYSSWADNRFSASNPNGSYPRVTDRASNAISGGQYNNTFWLNDASFIRLKNVQLGYNFKSQFLSKLKLGGIRVYASGFNLFTITKVKDYDPEGTSGSGQFYPQQRIINLGANVKF